jgi:trehalose 6-phosphate synthase/phosphatase
VIQTLKLLCQDPNNLVYVLSGKGREEVSESLGEINGLGLVAEAGFFFRRANSPPLITKYGDPGFDSQWERLVSDGHSSWKTIAKAVMEVYMERTHGVYIQEEESAVAWQFRDADPEFAHIQSKELEDQLKQLLKTLNVDIVRGEDYVEVRPKGISKGDFIRSLLDELVETKQTFPDFVLCIGDDTSDEKSFQVYIKYNNICDVNLPKKKMHGLINYYF